MTPLDFDALTRRMVLSRSRQVSLGLVAALGLAAKFGTDDAVAACKANRKPCQRADGCCSGVCSGKKGRKRCQPANQAQGCTATSGDLCMGVAAACPDNPDAVCTLLDKGEPFCAALADSDCIICRKHSDCLRKDGFGKPRCVQSCEFCPVGSACFYPAPPPS